MSSFLSQKCDVQISNTKKSNSIRIQGLSKIACEMIRKSIEDGCFISFFGDYEKFLDVIVDCEEN